MECVDPLLLGPANERRWVGFGKDGRGLDVGVVALDLSEYPLAIHAMPVTMRRGRRTDDT